MTLADDRGRLEAARVLVGNRRIGQAVAALRALVAERPDLHEAYELLATALEASGDGIGAEHALREVLKANPAAAGAASRLANLLTARRRASEAIEMLSPLIDHPNADFDLHTAYGLALKGAGRREDAAEAYARAADLAPNNAVAQHNLASALGDVQRFAECEVATRRAFAMGLDAPESWLVLGRALMGLARFDEAEAAFRQAIHRRAGYPEAHAELAQLIWMRTAELGAAIEALNTALGQSSDPALVLAKAKVLEYAGDVAGAYELVVNAIAGRPLDARLQVTAANLIMSIDAELALDHARTAHSLSPDSGPAVAAFCQANLAAGNANVAARLAEALCVDWPLDQYPVNLAGTAWRILGDDRYRQLYDYDRLVSVTTIETPVGWSNLTSYLGDLASTLKALLHLSAHPIGQSLRNGVQSGESLALSADPVIRAFFAAIDGPIDSYIRTLALKDDVLGRRVTSGYRFAGAWTVLLRPGGHHVNHIHPLGWISSAFHVELPEAVEEGRQGWLKFGEPGTATSPVLGPEHFVKPKPGNLVLFPSYMWHGTVPFAGEQPRLTAAFDVLPA